MDITNITKKYKNNVILRDLNFSFNKSRIVGLIGKNGAGKTTVMKIMNGNIVNYTGKVNIDNHEKIGYLIEYPKLYMDTTGLNNLKLFSRILGSKFDKEFAEEIVSSFGMNEYINKKVKKYSLGMKQKLAIAVSLISKPQYLILDEPTNGMDPDGSIDVLKTIKSIAEENDMKVLISSHKLEDIELICDRAIFLRDGKFIRDIDMKKNDTKNFTIIQFKPHDYKMGKECLSTYFKIIESSEEKISIEQIHDYSEILKPLSEINIYPKMIQNKMTSLRDAYFDINKGE
ncbi:phenol-soluble modulin export ABC transporter ATP-binding protein PmtC [Staphylococcus delphini]|uniref:phenol-soluble modulin export ABC transporter ATP-binding protein PmtC n=1 Tax=Staphylococcus delphini TaxID=53344 RepID=UPI0023B2F7C2|nr:ABC transporter ATP-binding protein [Staphylococcus delphini]MDE9751759.1 ABC transporter ATP-binding protein [Staphylococcus delphini]MDE9789036.1 ABC transporter ATP-binding protein [Staphylococcus delphini]MDE9791331.1 ABC transporter ATP-binding protein [Staphylococcus delphini]MDE9793661.1 ABC transporter ATP-binding protein [Staphylococcus delphini]MDE9795989.1 ABC transporter ATP-binding protein [Staphylococcus delphini]